MKFLATLALLVAVSAHAQTDNVQYACSFLAAAGEGAALSNAAGVDELEALKLWIESVDQHSNGEYANVLKNVGAAEVGSVYAKGITAKEEGYWEGYQTCVETLK